MSAQPFHFKFTFLTPLSYSTRECQEEANDANVEQFVEHFIGRATTEFHMPGQLVDQMSEAFIQEFDAFQERYIKDSEFVVILVSTKSAPCLAKFYPRLFVFLQSRPEWSNRFILIYLGPTKPGRPFDEDLFTTKPIQFPETDWKNDQASWTELFHCLQMEWIPYDSSSSHDEDQQAMENSLEIPSRRSAYEDVGTTNAQNELDEISLYHEVYPDEDIREHKCDSENTASKEEVELIKDREFQHIQSEGCSWDRVESRLNVESSPEVHETDLPLFQASVNKSVTLKEEVVQLPVNVRDESFAFTTLILDDFSSNKNDDEEEEDDDEVVYRRTFPRLGDPKDHICTSLNQSTIEEVHLHYDHWIYTSQGEACSWKVDESNKENIPSLRDECSVCSITTESEWTASMYLQEACPHDLTFRVNFSRQADPPATTSASANSEEPPVEREFRWYSKSPNALMLEGEKQIKKNNFTYETISVEEVPAHNKGEEIFQHWVHTATADSEVFLGIESVVHFSETSSISHNSKEETFTDEMVNIANHHHQSESSVSSEQQQVESREIVETTETLIEESQLESETISTKEQVEILIETETIEKIQEVDKSHHHHHSHHHHEHHDHLDDHHDHHGHLGSSHCLEISNFLILTPQSYSAPTLPMETQLPNVNAFHQQWQFHLGEAVFQKRIRTLTKQSEVYFENFADFHQHLMEKPTDILVVLVTQQFIHSFETFFARLFVFVEFNEEWKEKIVIVFVDSCQIGKRYNLDTLLLKPIQFDQNDQSNNECFEALESYHASINQSEA